MQKYVIVSKNVFQSTSTNDINDPLLATEICTELIIMRLRLIELLNTGIINKNDVIVTRIERKCLYENIFPNIIDYQDFLKLNIQENVIDIVSQIYTLCKTIKYKPFYNRFELDKEQILNIKLSTDLKFDVSQPFICLLIRKRGAWPEKNLPDNYWYGLINYLNTLNIRIAVFGKETERFCDNINSFHINSFQDWCAILSYSTCKCVISTATGGVYPIFFTGHKKSKLIIIDNTLLIRENGHDASFYNNCINFTNTELMVLETVPDYPALYNTIVIRFDEK